MILEIYKVGYLAPTKIEMLEIGNHIVTETLDINALTEKTALVAADWLALADSEDSNTVKKFKASKIFPSYLKEDIFFLDGQNQLANKVILESIVTNNCYVIGIGTVLKTQRTAGTIDFEITKNGVGLTPTGLDIQINASYPLDRYASVAYGTTGYDFSAGDLIRVEITTTTFAPLANLGKIFLIIQNIGV